MSVWTTAENSQREWRCTQTWRGMVVRSRQGGEGAKRGGAAATGKARSPTVDNRVRRTISDDDDAERRRLRASTSDDRRNPSLARYTMTLSRARVAWWLDLEGQRPQVRVLDELRHQSLVSATCWQVRCYTTVNQSVDQLAQVDLSLRLVLHGRLCDRVAIAMAAAPCLSSSVSRCVWSMMNAACQQHVNHSFAPPLPHVMCLRSSPALSGIFDKKSPICEKNSTTFVLPNVTTRHPSNSRGSLKSTDRKTDGILVLWEPIFVGEKLRKVAWLAKCGTYAARCGNGVSHALHA